MSRSSWEASFMLQMIGKAGGSLRRKPTISFDLRRMSNDSTPRSSSGPNEKKEKVIVIAGPTGAGKSRLALELAKKLNGEVISADSVQVYRGLDVGSSKPSIAEQKEVPHHLIDILIPSDEYSAGQFFKDARNATQEVISKGKVPIVAGGTGLYLRWYIYGKPDVPKPSFEITSEVCSELLHLQEKCKWDEAVELVVNSGDSKALSLSLNDWYRLRRSLEIIRTSGSPPSAFAVPYDSFKQQEAVKDLDFDFLCFFFTSPRVDLYRAIDLRCERMLMETEGLLREASWLLDIGLQPNVNSVTRAIGYRQAMEYLLECRKNGGKSMAKCFLAFLYDFQKASRNFAKRQTTWFRNELIYQWIDASRPMDIIVDFVYRAYNNGNEQLMVPTHLQIKKDVYDRKESIELKSYRTKNRFFRNEADCQHILQWIWRTQQR
ncbi:hypothetical protein HPP92_012452 [Vanilla planifolia]|uniref:tRNA dimethylallyltransferase n=1 Tax=Vanilla planifolia TaxID=51239 RepID=A0A835QTS9_VANPL|nr:hypothetical protein HPP92_012452 [Vanilla planifolia]